MSQVQTEVSINDSKKRVCTTVCTLACVTQKWLLRCVERVISHTMRDDVEFCRSNAHSYTKNIYQHLSTM